MVIEFSGTSEASAMSVLSLMFSGERLGPCGSGAEYPRSSSSQIPTPRIHHTTNACSIKMLLFRVKFSGGILRVVREVG